MTPLRLVAVFWLAVFCASGAQAQVLDTLFETGPKDQRINIVVLSEGYTSGQLTSNFRRDAAGLVEAMMARQPYASYRNYFNAYAISVASNQSGADYPEDGIVRDTYFQATYGTGDSTRLLYLTGTGTSRVNSLLASLIPLYDIPLVLVNDTHYGGSGGAIAVASIEASASEVVVHEIGHSFANLGDEYDYPGSVSDETPNTTQTTDRALIRWRHWIAGGTPVPTPETSAYGGVTGLFEGAAYQTTGWYRPTLDSLMQTLGKEFGPVNEEAIVLSMLERLPGIVSATPAAATVSSTDGQPLTFRVNGMRPGGAPFSPVTWYVDGAPVSGAFPDQTLVALGSTWKYSAAAAAPAAAWKTTAFNDSAWPQGPAPLGFGDNNEATVVPGGPSNSRYPAIYFRRSFAVSNPALFKSLRLELRRDDGAVVYLNGTEVYRSNMATGAFSHTTLAATNEGDASEFYYYDAILPVSGLVAGTNLLAVEVHQNSLTSGDLKFDLSLKGRLDAYPQAPFIQAG
ncbi:MAG TPA: M64 family metallopeptidase, partial [Verrucomicrobiales bacterium]|nr:M64 family metallopeptidase [Verrucomicrobiales bacterium]